MAEYLSPGVYVEEYDSSARTIEGVGTSTAGFVGLAERGSTKGAPELVTSFADFTKQYGGFLSEFTHGQYRFLAHSVEQFFANGGTRCYVSRVAPSDAKKAFRKCGILSAEASSEGKWGNNIQITLKTAARRKLQLVAREGESYLAKTVDGFQEGDLIQFGNEINRIQKIYDRTITFEEELEGEIVDSRAVPEVFGLLMEVDLQIRCNNQTETYTGLNFHSASPNYIEARTFKSALVKLGVELPEKLCSPVEAVFGEGIREGMFSLEQGSDGSISRVDAGTFIGMDEGPGQRSGIQAFLESKNVSMLAVPGITMPEVVVALVSHCENTKNKFAVLDMPAEMTNTKELIEYRGMIDSTYAAMYHPWIQVYDRAANKPAFVPPSGAVMGVYSRTDVTRGVHKAPANETVACTGLSVGYTEAEQNILNPEGINLIRSIPGQGIKIWGARTAGSNSAFQYVNIRRLFIFVEESIKANTNWVVFEPNDATLWSRVQMTVASFLDNLWRSGMLAGSSPAEGYFVEIGAATMTEDDIKGGRLICNIGIAPSRPAEFVIFRVTQHTSEAGG